MENKESIKSIKSIAKKYWWVVLLIIIAPVLLNFILPINTGLPVVGDDTHWLGFWGNYLGGIVSSLCAFVILHETIKANKEVENKKRFYERRDVIVTDFTNALAHLQTSELRFIHHKFQMNSSYTGKDDVCILTDIIHQCLYYQNSIDLKYGGMKVLVKSCEDYQKVSEQYKYVVGETIYYINYNIATGGKGLTNPLDDFFKVSPNDNKSNYDKYEDNVNNLRSTFLNNIKNLSVDTIDNYCE